MPKKGIPKGPFWKFFIVDVIVIIAALALAFVTHFNNEFREQNLLIYETLFAVIVLVRTLSLFVCGMYDFSRPKFAFDIIYYTSGAIILAHLIEYALIFYMSTYYGYQISRYVIFWNFIFSLIGHASWRILYLRRRHRWGYDRTRLLIVGAGEMGESVQRDIQEYARLGHEVIGLVDDDIEHPTNNGSPVLGKILDIPDISKKFDIDEIIVTSRQANRQELLNILSLCQQCDCKVRLLPELYEVTIGQVIVEQVGGVPLITVNAQRLNERLLLLKRVTDISVSIIGLIALALVLPFVYTAIRLNSSGPVFYQQERIGYKGKVFQLLKFRTMYEDAELETGPIKSWNKDPRVTAVGRFLRKWHLDELPQFINVLKGEMSLVGPRPERPHFAERYARQIPAYRLREEIRPGVTGLAQIHGFYNSPVEHKLRYDLAYMNSMSYLLDLKIMLLTLRVTLTGHNGVLQ